MIDHPLVLRYLDSFRNDDETAFLVTEYAELGDLHKILKVYGQVPRVGNDEVLAIMF